MSAVIERAVGWTELGLVPDSVVRAGIRRLLENKRKEIHADDLEYAARELNQFVAMMNRSPIALVPDLANEQHYEVPAEFFVEVMGDHLKYSCGYWPAGVETLTDSEAAALRLATKRAGIEDGMQVLDLGCGWGALSLWIAENFPQCGVTSVSNSSSQREFILHRAEQKGLKNIRVFVQDMNDFVTEDRFDRIVSVEMFEHMRNYGELFNSISRWLVPDGKFFVLNVTARQDSIIDKQSSVKSVPLPKQIHPYVPGDHDPERMKIIHFRKNVTVDPKKQAGLNMWRERRYAGSYLISDTFFDALKSQNLRLMGSFKAKDLQILSSCS